MVFIARPRAATLVELRYFLGSPGEPISTKEILDFMESLTPEERRELRRNPDIPQLNYWDLLDAEERKYKDD